MTEDQIIMLVVASYVASCFAFLTAGYVWGRRSRP